MSTSSINPLSSLDTGLSTTSTGSATSGTGLGQGINVQQFVQFAVANQQANITALETEQTSLGSQNTEISTIASDLNALQTAAQALSNPLGALNAELATSSNSSALSATATGSASSGAHTISIANLATTSSYYSDQAASATTALATGDTLSITVGGNTTPVTTITTSSTLSNLSEIAAAINQQTTAVQASVITDATGSRLALVSATSGAPGAIGVTGSLHLTDTNNTALAFHVASAGVNASLTVDGVPVTSTSNTVSGAINGVSLTLTAPTLVNNVDTPVSLTVAPDSSQATGAINSFVSAYNSVVTEINNQFNVASNGTGGGVLESDNSLQQVQSLILGAASYSLTGNNGIVNLASIGVNLNNDGTLSVDNSALSSALSSNFSAVQNLFQNATTGFAQNLNTVINTVSGPGNGILTLDSQSNSTTAQSIGQQVSDLQAALVAQEQSLTTLYSQVNTTLQELPLLQNQLTQQLAGIP
jgi:flagellar hook-associated protein 2